MSTELENFKQEIKNQPTKELVKTARTMRKYLAVLDTEIQSRKGPSS